MSFSKKPPSIEEAKLLSERMEIHDQLKVRLKKARDRLTAAGTTGAEKLELQELLIGIETEMAAFVAESNSEAVVDPLKVVEEADTISQKKIDERNNLDAAQQTALDEMRRKEVAGIAY